MTTKRTKWGKRTRRKVRATCERCCVPIAAHAIHCDPCALALLDSLFGCPEWVRVRGPYCEDLRVERDTLRARLAV